MTAYLNVLETRSAQLEMELDRYRTRAEAQLSALSRICDTAGQVLERARLNALQLSGEERELQEVVTKDFPKIMNSQNKIPPSEASSPAPVKSPVPVPCVDLKTLLSRDMS